LARNNFDIAMVGYRLNRNMRIIAQLHTKPSS